ncbi:hypothetical protein P43SY_003700 [Pythium insidiosum]|uniref:Tetratricopeptide repeat protein n=1 Tax=Pythium insidiosum TaxID=114742 RepID=A0AAD5M1K6_PYTIN|nr:hypothetical protein P43SY_003700 [Pythium insidiosum]
MIARLAIAQRSHRPAASRAVAAMGSSLGHRSRFSSSAHELLKRDFKRWARREAAVLAILLTAGVTGVYFYQHRDSAPSQQVTRQLDLAAKCAQAGDREAAVRHTVQAYSITKATNAQDRHLFELAFAVAAQYETLGKASSATRYYLDALHHVPFVRGDDDVRAVDRLVVLDRIAQSYQDIGEQRAAENYYRQAIEVYDRVIEARQSEDAELKQIDLEIPVVLYNYGQQLLHLKRWDDARQVLSRARHLAAPLSIEHRLRIDRLLRSVDDESEDGGDNHGTEEQAAPA